MTDNLNIISARRLLRCTFGPYADLTHDHDVYTLRFCGRPLLLLDSLEETRWLCRAVNRSQHRRCA